MTGRREHNAMKRDDDLRLVDNNKQAPASMMQDSGLIALCMIGAYHRLAVQPAQLHHELGLGRNEATPDDLVRAASRLGLKARAVSRVKSKKLAGMPLPAIIQTTGGRFVLLAAQVAEGVYRLIDPLTHAMTEENETSIETVWNRRVILVTRRVSIEKAAARFSFRWFLAPLWRYRKPLGQVLAASLFIQICGLLTPLFFQLTIDKVLVYKGYSTLALVVVGLLMLGVFQGLLQHLRSYVLSHTTSRIDVELGARIFDHLLRLPLSYFETRPTGQTVARMREMETIRAFLTGQGLTSAIDCLFAAIFVAVLALYSPFLTLIVLGSIPFYVMIAAGLRPLLRVKIEEMFASGAASQQFLVEAVVGVNTVKSSAIEPQLRTQWEEKLAAYVRTAFDSAMLSSLGQNGIQYVNKVSTALVLFFGARAVMDGSLTVGGLIAFNMIMNQATAPILRLSQLWQDFQQVQVSVERIGDILNTAPESRSLAQAHLPPARGEIRFDDVLFRYRTAGTPVLQQVSIEIPEGQVIGIVGPSGSGKSTFTKLLQRLYTPEMGRILIDGVDISQVDPAWLRRQIGVVLQENLLFNRTVHDNIALANPGMDRGQVMMLAKLSGADEFINKLPLGYDTVIEERGANLSGGQRQRIAIARALSTNPRILIFDEATSALDYESEQLIQTNMQQITKGRTVLIIAHRLAAVRRCDRIIAIQNGRIVEDGTHRDLLDKPDSVYGRLWRLQGHEVADAA